MPTPSNPLRHRWIDPKLHAGTPQAKALVDHLGDQIDGLQSRKRTRKAADKELHERRLDMLFCNLLLETLKPSPTGRIAVLLRKARGDQINPLFSTGWLALIEKAEKIGIIDVIRSRVKGTSSSISPTEQFRHLVGELGFLDLTREPPKDLIRLRRKTSTSGEKATSRNMCPSRRTSSQSGYSASIWVRSRIASFKNVPEPRRSHPD